MNPQITISLDFELRWGVQDKLGDDFSAYRRNLEGVRDAVPAMLELFTRLGVRATWATVAAVACENWDEYEHRAPAWPKYRDRALAWRPSFRSNDPEGRLYFAPELVELIRATPGQELGSHTFSHVYMNEPGFVRRDAIGDTAAVIALFRDRWQTSPTSFVFPRNQVVFQDVLADAGFTVWRDNPTVFFWSATTATTAAAQSSAVRWLRLADSVAPLGSRAFDRRTQHRASHLVRLGLPTPLWKAHVRRLVSEARSVQPDQALHLWWHPHNLGANVPKTIGRLEQLFGAMKAAAPTACFASMAEVGMAN